jgi:molecular chaperone HtpG
MSAPSRPSEETTMTQTKADAQTLEFRAELKQLLHLITHSLYSNKEIFLRELISNASDAINRIKFDSLQHEERLEGNKDWKIKITLDREKGTLTVSDNGIGMSRERAAEDLGTIARSGTRAFLEGLKAQEMRAHPELIGQFGVGFYSAFMVADKVTVLSRMAGDPKEGVRWESAGQGEFTVEPYEKPARGTDVILHLKPEEKEFLEPFRLRQIIKKFSDFIEHPVVMEVEREEGGKKEKVEEVINARKAIWLRARSENTPEEYHTFYKQITHDFADPAKVIHYTAEGAQEFRVLVFIPAHRPLEMQWGDYQWGLRLYVQRVLIMEHCEALLPAYLRFVRGVVDSSDLPLNISREMLQHNPLLEQIKRDVTGSVLKALGEMRRDEYEKYVSFYREFGSILKEGPGRDWANREKVADLLLFESAKTGPGKYLTLAQYVEAMPAGQKEIYYLTGEDREVLAHSPYLEGFRARGQDVLLMTDPVDEFLVPSLGEYRGKRFRAVDQADLEEVKPEGGEEEKFKGLFEFLKKELPEVEGVRLSGRLKESAACLVAPEGGVSAHMERLLRRLGKAEEAGPAKRVLELNAAHPAVQALRGLYEKDPGRAGEYARLLYDEAVLAEGSRVKDPAALARRINELLVRDAGR